MGMALWVGWASVRAFPTRMILWFCGSMTWGGCGAAGGSGPMAAPAAGMVTGRLGTGGSIGLCCTGMGR